MANVSDLITDTRNAARPASTTASSPRSAGGATLSCASLTGWPTASKVHGVTYQIDSAGDPIAGTQLDFYAIRSGNDLTSFTVVDGTDTGNSIGDVVEMLPTAAWGQDLADALTEEHERTGVHNASAIATIGDALYPVGSIYVSTVSTNPATLFGFGTWAAFGAGRTLIGVGTSDAVYAAGATGGASTHTLTTPEIPSHSHTQRIDSSYNAASGGSATHYAQNNDGASAATSGFSTGTTGGGGAHNNLQPYIVVYMWQRTA